MVRLFNIALVGAVILVAVFLYRIEHTTRKAEREIRQIERQIAAEKERIKMLEAEWSFLTRPKRLQVLAEIHLGLQSAEPDQIVPRLELREKLPEVPATIPHAARHDPIAAMVRELR